MVKVSAAVIELVDNWRCDGSPEDGSLEVAIQRLLDATAGRKV